jgi:hypothetical protein
MITVNNYGLLFQQKTTLIVDFAGSGGQKNKHGLTGLMLFFHLKIMNYLLWEIFINKIVNTNTYTKNIIFSAAVLDCKNSFQKYLFGEKSILTFVHYLT